MSLHMRQFMGERILPLIKVIALLKTLWQNYDWTDHTRNKGANVLGGQTDLWQFLQSNDLRRERSLFSQGVGYWATCRAHVFGKPKLTYGL